MTSKRSVSLYDNTEAGARANVTVAGDGYQRVLMRGILTATNFKERPIRLFIRCGVVGRATVATAGGKIMLANIYNQPRCCGRSICGGGCGDGGLPTQYR
mgnify:CR=1 FL=1